MKMILLLAKQNILTVATFAKLSKDDLLFCTELGYLLVLVLLIQIFICLIELQKTYCLYFEHKTYEYVLMIFITRLHFVKKVTLLRTKNVYFASLIQKELFCFTNNSSFL